MASLIDVYAVAGNGSDVSVSSEQPKFSNNRPPLTAEEVEKISSAMDATLNEYAKAVTAERKKIRDAIAAVLGEDVADSGLFNYERVSTKTTPPYSIDYSRMGNELIVSGKPLAKSLRKAIGV